ncbi:hypothetical protein GKQ38_02755 [Candidatus Nanohaloarchaea archaeon]|nr:hypothetical protein GKQ38_02755 [Candidatus Nanohaloarchaea archaeon]
MSASTEYVNTLLEEVDEVAETEGPPLPMIDEDFWAEISHNMADSLVVEQQDDLLNEMEKQGAKLMLSPDQKRVRPGVYKEIVDSLDSNVPEEELGKVATLIETIHFYTKGLDDIQDGDEVRNGEKTLHAHMADLLGDEDLAESLANNYFIDIKTRNRDIVSELSSEYFSAEDREQIRDALGDAENGLVHGQNLDLTGTQIGDDELGLKPNYLGGDLDVMDRMVTADKGKTAKLFGLIGSLAEISTEYEGEEIREWGENAGQAFQIADDVLDFRQERFSDIRDGNYTVPIYVAERFLHTHPDEELNQKGEYLTEIIQKEDPGDYELEEAYDIIVEDTPAMEASENLSRYLTEEANEYLEEVDWEKEDAKEKIQFMTEMMGYGREK